MTILQCPLQTTPPAPTPAATAPPASPLRELPGPVLLTLTLAILVAWTLRRTLDPVIDFGRELYTPWQLSQGKHLYTDIAAFYGPLSQYFNALAIRLLGPTLSTLIIVNTALLALAMALLYAILRSLSSQLAATAAALMFLIMFATAHMGAVGNFNFITPYSHEATHGFILSLAALLAFFRFAKTRRRRWALALGLFTGLVFLTKPEIFVALAGAITVGLILHARTSGFHPRPLALTLSSVLLPPLLMTLFLATQIPFPQALRGTLGAWMFLTNHALTQSAFYANSMGLQNPRGQLALIAVTAFRFIALLLPALLAALYLNPKTLTARILGVSIGLVSALLIALLEGLPWWQFAGEILLLSTLVIAGVQSVAFVKNRDPKAVAPAVLRLTLLAFALLILLKMFLHTRFHQYGFVLAVIPTMVLALALLDWFPAYLTSKNKSGITFRAAAFTALAMLAAVSLSITAANLAAHSQPVGDPPNNFFTDDRAPVFNDMIHYVQQNTRPDQTLTVLPEGVLLNVLTRRRSSIPYLSTIPSDLAMFGEPAILHALQQSPPDFILILNRTTDDFGQKNFGNDYALTLRNWIMQHYHPAHLSGATPFTSQSFGILLLTRNP